MVINAVTGFFICLVLLWLLVAPLLAFLGSIFSFIIQVITFPFTWTWTTYTPIDSMIKAFLESGKGIIHFLSQGVGLYSFLTVYFSFCGYYLFRFLYGLIVKKLIAVNREIRRKEAKLLD